MTCLFGYNGLDATLLYFDIYKGQFWECRLALCSLFIDGGFRFCFEAAFLAVSQTVERAEVVLGFAEFIPLSYAHHIDHKDGFRA